MTNLFFETTIPLIKKNNNKIINDTDKKKGSSEVNKEFPDFLSSVYFMINRSDLGQTKGCNMRL